MRYSARAATLLREKFKYTLFIIWWAALAYNNKTQLVWNYIIAIINKEQAVDALEHGHYHSSGDKRK